MKRTMILFATGLALVLPATAQASGVALSMRLVYAQPAPNVWADSVRVVVKNPTGHRHFVRCRALWPAHTFLGQSYPALQYETDFYVKRGTRKVVDAVGTLSDSQLVPEHFGCAVVR
jgi:hypothetical protein